MICSSETSSGIQIGIIAKTYLQKATVTMTIMNNGMHTITYSEEEESNVCIVSSQVIILICTETTKRQILSRGWTLPSPFCLYILLKLHKRVS